MNIADNIIRAAMALEAKLEEVHASEEFKDAWAASQASNGPYNGPSYIGELAALRKALEKRNAEIAELIKNGTETRRGFEWVVDDGPGCLFCGDPDSYQKFQDDNDIPFEYCPKCGAHTED